MLGLGKHWRSGSVPDATPSAGPTLRRRAEQRRRWMAADVEAVRDLLCAQPGLALRLVLWLVESRQLARRDVELFVRRLGSGRS